MIIKLESCWSFEEICNLGLVVHCKVHYRLKIVNDSVKLLTVKG